MGRNVQLLAVQVYSQCGARGVRGNAVRAVRYFVTSFGDQTESIHNLPCCFAIY